MNPSQVARGAVAKTRTTVRSQRASNIWLPYLMLAAFIMHVLSMPLLRQMGIAGFLPFIVIAAIYVAARPHPLLRSWVAIGYLIAGSVVILLSYLQLMPVAWTRIYDANAIMRQSYFIFAFFILLMAFAQMWSDLEREGKLGMGILLFAISSGIATVSMAIVGMRDVSESLVPNLTTFGLGNFLGFGYLIAHQRPFWRKTGSVLFFAFILALSSTAQTLISAAILVALIFMPWRRLVTVGFVALWLIVPMVAQAVNVNNVGITDVNTLIRILFWQDAFRGLLGSWLIGVGFGTESVQNYYLALPKLSPYELDELMWQSIHNTFLINFFRLGVIGGVLFIMLAVIKCFPERVKGASRDIVARYAYVLAIFTMSVNVGEGPFFLVGACAALGLSVALSGTIAGRSAGLRSLQRRRRAIRRKPGTNAQAH